MLWDRGFLEFMNNEQMLLILFAVWVLLYMLSFAIDENGSWDKHVKHVWLERVLFITIIWFVVIGCVGVVDAFVIIYHFLGGIQ